MAFTKSVRTEIKERAEHRSELSGTNSRPLVCAHFFHIGKKKSKKRRRIDCAENGLFVTDIEHYAHHLIFQSNPKAIGLDGEQNDSTITAFVDYFEGQFRNGELDPEELNIKLGEAITLWVAFYEDIQEDTHKHNIPKTNLVITPHE